MVRGKRYEKVTVELDGKTFTRCVFEGCVLTFRGKQPYQLIGCELRDCRWSVADTAAMVIHCLAASAPVDAVLAAARRDQGAAITLGLAEPGTLN